MYSFIEIEEEFSINFKGQEELVLISKSDLQKLKDYEKAEEEWLRQNEKFQDSLAKKRYAAQFYNGFDLNKIDEDLKSVYVFYAYNEEGYYPLHVGQSETTRSAIRNKLSEYKATNRIRIVPVEKEITKDMTPNATRMFIRNMFSNLLQAPSGYKESQKSKPMIELNQTKLNISQYNADTYAWEELKQ
ncbi:hypothetical protein [Bacillus nitratireducens]|uniref:hypothetical protein n=1 Tax=Bacillus nitratireducens TaxID=2026193 RepID=UPI002E1EAD96|nr:hypothetical protein [Bacillus nitratireducens]